jgi:hypothetical protein
MLKPTSIDLEMVDLEIVKVKTSTKKKKTRASVKNTENEVARKRAKQQLLKFIVHLFCDDASEQQLKILSAKEMLEERKADL